MRLNMDYELCNHYFMRVIENEKLNIPAYGYLEEAFQCPIFVYKEHGLITKYLLIAEEEFYALQFCKIIQDRVIEKSRAFTEDMEDFSLANQRAIRSINKSLRITNPSKISVFRISDLQLSVKQDKIVVAGDTSTNFKFALLTIVKQTAYYPKIFVIDVAGFDIDFFIDTVNEYGTDSIFIVLTTKSIPKDFINKLVNYHSFRLLRVGKPSLEDLKDAAFQYADSIGLRISTEFVNRLLHSKVCSMNEVFLALDTVQATGEENLISYSEVEDSERKLASLIGLKDVKLVLKQILGRYKLNQYRAKKYTDLKESFYKHLLFSGKPGTGKTITARLFASLLAQNGLSNGVFIEASRADLVGRYLGETSIKVDELFQRAKGGVLFVDEVGSFVTSERDYFVKEAISGIVRHLELDEDTTVIFATYPDQAQQFIELDPGLASRITKIVEFPDYSLAELWSILKFMSANEHYVIEDSVRPILEEYVIALQNSSSESFGNARDVRKLFNAAVNQLALDDFNEESCDVLLASYFSKAVDELCNKKSKFRIGFRVQ